MKFHVRPLANRAKPAQPFGMVLIRFADAESKRRALEALVGEFSFKSWASGEMLVPEDALPGLAREDIPFSFDGSAAYEKLATLGDLAPASL